MNKLALPIVPMVIRVHPGLTSLGQNCILPGQIAKQRKKYTTPFPGTKENTTIPFGQIKEKSCLTTQVRNYLYIGLPTMSLIVH